jgi:plasmid stability protein
MAVNFSIKQVPEGVAKRLRQRAERNHRSLQRELLAIIEAAVATDGSQVAEPKPASYAVKTIKSKRAKRGGKQFLTLEELWQRAREIGPTPVDEPAAQLIRRDRDARSRR